MCSALDSLWLKIMSMIRCLGWRYVFANLAHWSMIIVRTFCKSLENRILEEPEGGFGGPIRTEHNSQRPKWNFRTVVKMHLICFKCYKNIYTIIIKKTKRPSCARSGKHPTCPLQHNLIQNLIDTARTHQLDTYVYVRQSPI